MNQNTSLNSTTPSARANPYVGSRPFRDGEALFGRDREVRELLNRLYSNRIVLLYSPSGAGKTSLIQAGLIPQLRQEGFKVLPVVRVGFEPPGRTLNRYLYSTFELLDCDLSPDLNSAASQSSLATCLSERLNAEAPDVNYMLIFDQFEEVLTTAPTDREGKQAYFGHLGEALNDKRVWALFAIREEFLGALDPFTRFLPTQFKHSFRLDLLSRPAALQAIQKPVEGLGMEFTAPAADQLVEDLCKVQVQEDGRVIEQSGLYVEPVLLQVVCTRLFNQLDLENNPEKRLIDENDVANLGKVNEALGDYYTEEITKAAIKWGIQERKIRDWVPNPAHHC